MKCRICGSGGLTEYLNLGEQPLADAFLSSREQFETEAVFPLAVLYCKNCSLSQLSYVVPPEILYKSDYPYETGMNTEGVIHFTRMANSLMDRFKPNFVVDIGSNDGTLLFGFNCKTCGIEPVREIAEKAGAHTINGFFDSHTVDEALVYGGKADIITACNVFAHVDNLHGFMWHIDRLLADKGVFVIEAPYLPDLIDNLAFDTIYHEHLSYLSIKPLIHLFREYGMEIFNCEYYDVHCGTMRYYIARRGVHPFSKIINLWYESEQEYHDIDRLEKFAKNVRKTRSITHSFLKTIKEHGKRVVGVSAPAKGNTFLNYCGIDDKILDYITEKSERKIGRYTPGTHIRIVPDSALLEEPQPDFALLLAHNWEKQIKDSLKGFRGKWINAKRFKDLYSRSLWSGRECDSKGTQKEGVHECCGIPCGTDKQVPDIYPIPEGTA